MWRQCRDKAFQWNAAENSLNDAGDMKAALKLLNERLREEQEPAARYEEWRAVVAAKEAEFPMWYPKRDDVIIPQWAIEVPPPSLPHLFPSLLCIAGNIFKRMH